MEKLVYKEGSLIDFKGKQRKFVITIMSTNNIKGELTTLDEDNFYDLEEKTDKLVYVGWSLCRAEDEWNLDVGIKIAKGRALAGKGILIGTSDSGILSKLVIESMLNQIFEYFMSNPAQYIKSYREAEKRYIKVQKAKEKYACLSTHEKEVFDCIKNSSDIDFDKLIEIATDYED